MLAPAAVNPPFRVVRTRGAEHLPCSPGKSPGVDGGVQLQITLVIDDGSSVVVLASLRPISPAAAYSGRARRGGAGCPLAPPLPATRPPNLRSKLGGPGDAGPRRPWALISHRLAAGGTSLDEAPSPAPRQPGRAGPDSLPDHPRWRSPSRIQNRELRLRSDGARWCAARQSEAGLGALERAAALRAAPTRLRRSAALLRLARCVPLVRSPHRTLTIARLRRARSTYRRGALSLRPAP